LWNAFWTSSIACQSPLCCCSLRSWPRLSRVRDVKRRNTSRMIALHPLCGVELGCFGGRRHVEGGGQQEKEARKRARRTPREVLRNG
jgi:hypothetical protein